MAQAMTVNPYATATQQAAANTAVSNMVATDTMPPKVTLIGAANMTIAQGSTFNDPGSVVSDNIDTGLIATVVGTVNTSVIGAYTLIYKVTDSAGNPSTLVARTVNVTDQTAPVITLNGTATVTVAQGSTFVDAGSVVTDTYSTALLTATVTGAVNTTLVGTYTLTYNVKDAAGNAATPVTRTVNVTDQTAPVITVAGAANVTVALGSLFTNPTSSVTDNYSTGLIAVVTGTVNTSALGTYTLTYNVKDAAGNTAIPVIRTVTVADLYPPKIALNGAGTMSVVLDSAFADPGSVVTDNYSTGLVATVTGTVNINALGAYTLTYNATDAAGNAAAAVTRTVNVVAAPVGVVLTIFDDSVFNPFRMGMQAIPTTAQQQTMIAQSGIAGAKVVVDAGGAANTYTTDAYGQVTIPGIDVGLHDLTVFADGFIWQSIYQMTFDPLQPNQFGLMSTAQQGINNGGGNSQFTLQVNLPIPQPANTIVELSITDAYANVYTATTHSWYNPPTLSNITVADFYINQSNPNTVISGVMTAREITCDVYGMNCTETNAANLGQVAYTTQPWAGTTLTPIGTVNVTYAPTHVTVPVTSNTGAIIGLNLLNSYGSPGQVMPANGWVNVNVDLTYTDSYGQIVRAFGYTQIQTQPVQDTYTLLWYQVVAPGPAMTMLYGTNGGTLTDSYGNPLPVGSTITATVAATELLWDNYTQTNSPRNYVNLGLQTLTVQSAPYAGFPAQALPASLMTTVIAAPFPVTPPVPTTVLNIQSVVPPVGVTFNGGMGADNWSTVMQAGSTAPFYSDYVNPPVLNGVSQAMVLPHQLKSYMPITGNVNFYGNGMDAYGYPWNVSMDLPVGSVVSYASLMTTPMSISPYQTGGVISIAPVNGGLLATGDVVIGMFDPYTQMQLWQFVLPLNTTSITLPTPPAGIVNPLVAGKIYLLDATSEIISGAGAPASFPAGVNMMSSTRFSMPANMNLETHTTPNIPYTY